jgi:hypothetical protein
LTLIIPNDIDFVLKLSCNILKRTGGVWMGDTMTVKESAILWGITERRVTVLCKEGRIEGAYKKGRRWVIPADAEKPIDIRGLKQSSSMGSLSAENRL